MATIFTKSTTVGNEKGLILDFREGLRYPFKIQDWTHIKVAMVWSYTALNNNDNMDGYGQGFITSNTIEDKMYFGLKKYTKKFPLSDNSEYFVGLYSSGTSSSIGFPVSAFSTNNDHGQVMNMGVQHPDGTKSGTTPAFSLLGVTQFDDTSNFAAIVALDLTIVNKGLSNQKITFKHAKIDITNTSKANIESQINSLTYTNLGDLDFNFNGVPYELPDTFFMYLPFGNVRMRVFALEVIRVS